MTSLRDTPYYCWAPSAKCALKENRSTSIEQEPIQTAERHSDTAHCTVSNRYCLFSDVEDVVQNVTPWSRQMDMVPQSDEVPHGPDPPMLEQIKTSCENHIIISGSEIETPVTDWGEVCHNIHPVIPLPNGAFSAACVYLHNSPDEARIAPSQAPDGPEAQIFSKDVLNVST